MPGMPKWMRNTATRAQNAGRSVTRTTQHATQAVVGEVITRGADFIHQHTGHVAPQTYMVGQLAQIKSGNKASLPSPSGFADSVGKMIDQEEFGDAAKYVGVQILAVANNSAHNVGAAIKAAPAALMEFAEHPWESAKQFGDAVVKKLEDVCKTIDSSEFKDTIKEIGAAMMSMCKGAYRTGKMQMEKAFKGLTKACGIQQSHGASR